jgi:hypothetical protein
MLVGIGCFLALWCIVPFFYEPARPHPLTAGITQQLSTIPHELAKEETFVIFIHGSLHVPLAFLSPLCVLYDSFTGISWYERTIQSLRHHSVTQQGGVVLSHGLHEATDLLEQQTLADPARYSGACHTMRAFRRMCPAKPHGNGIRRFFTFGWSGILSERERKLAAQQLYQELYELHQKSILLGKRVRIEIYAFSHGGQVALYLPWARKLAKNTQFTIDLLVLSAVPLYYRNTRNLLMGMFTTTINCYTPGDFAQTIDRFSTPTPPQQTIAKTILIPKQSSLKFIDLATYIGTNHPVPHCAFFDINQWDFPPRRVRRSEAYRTRYAGIDLFLTYLHPLPLVALYPLILEPVLSYLQVIEAPYYHMQLNLKGSQGTIEGEYRLPLDSTKPVSFVWPLPPLLTASQAELKAALQERKIPNQIWCLWYETVHAVGTFWKRQQ